MGDCEGYPPHLDLDEPFLIVMILGLDVTPIKFVHVHSTDPNPIQTFLSLLLIPYLVVPGGFPQNFRPYPSTNLTLFSRSSFIKFPGPSPRFQTVPYS